jgi:hypothetical protein
MTRAARRTTSEKPATELAIIQKLDDMITYCYQVTKQFPRSEKPGLARELREDCWKLMKLVVQCNKRYHKKTTMQDVDTAHEVLRRKIRKAMELELIPFRKYQHWSGLNDEIGRMIGGWIESQNPKGDGR